MQPQTSAVAPNAEILSVGTELLLGEIVDTNAVFLAGALSELGFEVVQAGQLPDDRAALAAAFRQARTRVELVVVTGGLGPTHDDVTREALADALGEVPVLHADLERTLRERFRSIGPMPQRNLRQATLIPSAIALENPIGSAPGWLVDRDGSMVVLMPGVPSEMRRMWTAQVVPRIAARLALRPLRKRVVRGFGIGESAVAERLGELLEQDDPQAGIYARDDGIHVRFSTRGDQRELDRLVRDALERLGDAAYGTDDTGLAEAALDALASRGAMTLATVETGTHGSLLAVLAEVAPAAGRARFVGGALFVSEESPPAPAPADVILRLALDARARIGASHATVSIGGSLGTLETRVRVFGSGPQRLRRAAFAALDQLRRFASPGAAETPG